MSGWLAVDCKGSNLGKPFGQIDIIVIIDHNRQIFLFDLRRLGIWRLSSFGFLFNNKDATKIFFECRDQLSAIEAVCKKNVDVHNDLAVFYHRITSLEQMEDIMDVMTYYRLIEHPAVLRITEEAQSFEMSILKDKETLKSWYKKNGTEIWEKRTTSKYLRYACLDAILTHRLHMFFKMLGKFQVLDERLLRENKVYSTAQGLYGCDLETENISKMPIVHNLPPTHCLLRNLCALKRIKEHAV